MHHKYIVCWMRTRPWKGNVTGRSKPKYYRVISPHAASLDREAIELEELVIRKIDTVHSITLDTYQSLRAMRIKSWGTIDLVFCGEVLQKWARGTKVTSSLSPLASSSKHTRCQRIP